MTVALEGKLLKMPERTEEKRKSSKMAEAEPTAADDEANLWYFAIGSMMLPQSCEHRHFYPQESRPAELSDFKMNFFGPMGFAEAVPSPGDSMHGVVHRVTPKQMLELDKVEIGYVRKMGKARPYSKNEEEDDDDQQQLIDVTVYCRPEESRKPEEDGPPRERYLEILIEGAKFHGVDPKYVEFLQNHEVEKRPLPHEFLSLGDPPSDVHFTDVPEPKEGKLYFTLNGKLLEFAFPPDNRHGAFFAYCRKKYGPHLEVAFSQVAFDLKYGIVNSVHECTPEHSAYIEDGQARFLKQFDEQRYCHVLGTYSYPNRSS